MSGCARGGQTTNRRVVAKKYETQQETYRVSQEGQLLDQESLRAVTGKTADWNEIAKDCSAFSNATGGRLLLGIEDGQDGPPAGQHIPADLPDTVRQKLAERTVTGPMNQRLLSTMDDRNGAYYRLPTYAFGQSPRQPKHLFGQF